MPWKMNGDQIVVQDGNPVWVYDDGKESPFDAGKALTNLHSVTQESMKRKDKIRDLEAKLEPYSDIDDPSEFISSAKKALDTVKNLKDKEIVDAGEIDKLKSSVAQEFKSKISEIEKAHAKKVESLEEQLSGKDSSIRNLLVKGAFTQSEFIREKTVLPPDFAFDSFGKNFQVEENDQGDLKAVAVRSNGEKIFSLKNAGSYADPEEAIEILITEHPDKDRLLRGGTPGSGSHPSSSPSGKAAISRSQFDAMPVADRNKFVSEGGTVTD